MYKTIVLMIIGMVKHQLEKDNVEECAEKNNPMYFDNEYSLWHYKPQFTTVSRPRVNNKSLIDGKIVKETTRLSLYRKSKAIDFLKAKSTLCSIFVHSADAWIV